MTYFGQMDYGIILSADKAAPILAAFDVTRESRVDPINGMDVTYQGKHYTILQRSVEWPEPTAYSPDGTHIVYALSPEEVEWKEEQKRTKPDYLSDLFKLGGLAIAVYAGVAVLGFFKK